VAFTTPTTGLRPDRPGEARLRVKTSNAYQLTELLSEHGCHTTSVA
jgi:hypothetical protein